MGMSNAHSSNGVAKQVKRNISGPIVVGSEAQRRFENEQARRWLLRIGVMVTFFILPVVVYLAVSITSLQTALQESNRQQQQLITELHTSKQTNRHGAIRRDTSQLPPRVQFNKKKVLVLTTKVGDIRIVLRPDLSKESVDYIEQTVITGCKRCNIYRAEAPGVLQGAIEGKQTDATQTIKGPCPAGYEKFPNPPCPEVNSACGCHGPVMSHGLVAWAAGLTGPDFFINNYPHERATWWGTQHTCFGEIQDDASFAVIESIWELPTHKIEHGLRNILNDILDFTMKIEEDVVGLDQ